MVGETSNPEALTTMGLYKICDHGTAAKKRCDHAWWGSFRGQRVSLPKWTNRAIRTKEDADAALDDLKAAIRAGTLFSVVLDFWTGCGRGGYRGPLRGRPQVSSIESER